MTPTVVNAAGGRAPRRGYGQVTVTVLLTVSEWLDGSVPVLVGPAKVAAAGGPHGEVKAAVAKVAET